MSPINKEKTIRCDCDSCRESIYPGEYYFTWNNFNYCSHECLREGIADYYEDTAELEQLEADNQA